MTKNDLHTATQVWLGLHPHIEGHALANVLHAIIDAIPDEAPKLIGLPGCPVGKRSIEDGPKPVEVKASEPTSKILLYPVESHHCWSDTKRCTCCSHPMGGYHDAGCENIPLVQRSEGTAAASGATQPVRESFRKTPAQFEDDARKLRIIKAMEEVADRMSGARFAYDPEVGWSAYSPSCPMPHCVFMDCAPSEAKSEEPLWEGELVVRGSDIYEYRDHDVTRRLLKDESGWRKIKVRETRE